MLPPCGNLGIKIRQPKSIRPFNHAPRRRIRNNALTMNCRTPVNPELHFRRFIIKMHPNPRIAR